MDGIDIKVRRGVAPLFRESNKGFASNGGVLSGVLVSKLAAGSAIRFWTAVIAELLTRIAVDSGRNLQVETITLSILFTGNKEIAKLNGDYRMKSYPTDVLSFPYSENPEIGNLLGDVFGDGCVGDLVISLEKACTQAEQYQVSLGDEVLRLIIHGVLHLFGYEHEGVARCVAEQMRRAEKRYARELYRCLAGEA